MLMVVTICAVLLVACSTKVKTKGGTPAPVAVLAPPEVISVPAEQVTQKLRPEAAIKATQMAQARDRDAAQVAAEKGKAAILKAWQDTKAEVDIETKTDVDVDVTHIKAEKAPAHAKTKVIAMEKTEEDNAPLSMPPKLSSPVVTPPSKYSDKSSNPTISAHGQKEFAKSIPFENPENKISESYLAEIKGPKEQLIVGNRYNKISESYLAEIKGPKEQLIVGNRYKYKVWIGPKSKKPVTVGTEMSASVNIDIVAKFAKVIPDYTGGKNNGLKLEIVGNDCQEITASGTEFPFNLIALIDGEYDVGAKIELYGSVKCNSTPHGLSPKPLHISIKAIAIPDIIHDRWIKFKVVVIDNVIKLLTGLLGAAIAAIIWLFRKKMFQRLGYKDEGNEGGKS